MLVSHDSFFLMQSDLSQTALYSTVGSSSTSSSSVETTVLAIAHEWFE